MVGFKKSVLAATLVALMGAGASYAGGISVSVGYADGLRGTGFFPTPWDGDAGVHFFGVSGPGADAGAIRVDNNTGGPVTFDMVTMTIPDVGAFFDLWPHGITIPDGDMLVLTETAHYNFDTSDYHHVTGMDGVNPAGPGNPAIGGPGAPIVDVTIGGVTTSFVDSGHVLDTQGFDYASVGNESFRWRPIGTTGDPAGTAATPLPSAAVAGMSLLGGLGIFRRFRRNAR
jgi:hypothetical protein